MHGDPHRRPVTAEAEVYRLIFDQLLPIEPKVPVDRAEVFRVPPRRRDPFAAGSCDAVPFGDLSDCSARRPYPVLGVTESGAPITDGNPAVHLTGVFANDGLDQAVAASVVSAQDLVLRVYLGPVEWHGPDDATVEAELCVERRNASVAARHWVWRVGRTASTWAVLRCEVIWGI
jgi:hypothetical protein